MRDQGALEEEPLVNRPDEFPMVNKVSNLLGMDDRDVVSHSQCEKKDVDIRKMGLVKTSPVKKESNSTSALKVYSRRKTCHIAKSMAHLNLGPILNEIGTEGDTRVMVAGNSFEYNKEGVDLCDSQSGPLTPKQDHQPHSPIPPSSFNNDFNGVEGDQHWEIARQLGISFDENFKNRNKEFLDEASTSHSAAATTEMGNNTIAP